MYQGAPHNGIAQPWWSNNSNSMSMVHGNNSNTVYSMDLRASFSLEYNVGSHIAEDFLLEDLSEFSNEDIAAPIINLLQGNNSSSLQHSDDNTSSKDPASLVKSCDTSGSHSLLLKGAAALDYRSAQQQASMKDSCFPPPSQDETGFDWLSSFGEDSLIYGASNFGMESFLLNTADPFGDSYDGLMKQGQGDISNVQDMKSGQGSGASDNDGGGGDNGDGRRDKSNTTSSHAMIMPHANNTHVTGRARSKRARSAGWSSSSILSSWSNSSPTNSLDSTSNLAHIPKPHSSSFLPCKQEEDHEHLDYHPHDMQLSSPNSKELNEDHNSDLSNISKLSSDQQAFNGWINKDDYREESVNINGGLQARRCTHCLSQKTPQWRAGPEGPKTLCNACGVRFKSGRLFDEYRPAKSPTFLSYRHSNSHKKVMEMRRRKGTSDPHYANHRPKHTDDQLIKLKVKLNSKLVEAQYHFADVTVINSQQSTRAAIDSSPGFLY